MAKRQYRARDGSPITNAQADIIGREVDAMQESGESVTPGKLVERAQSPSSPLHPLFDWNDQSAAYQYRLSWARTLIASVQVIEIRTSEPKKAYYSITAETGKRSYLPRREVLGSDAAMNEVSRDLYARLRAATREAVSIGLASSDPAWTKLCNSVEANTPAACVQEREVTQR